MSYLDNKLKNYKEKEKRPGVMGLVDVAGIGVLGTCMFLTQHWMMTASLLYSGYYMKDYATTEDGQKFVNEIYYNLTNEAYKNGLFYCSMKQDVEIASPKLMQECTVKYLYDKGGKIATKDPRETDMGTGLPDRGITSNNCTTPGQKCADELKKVFE